MENYIVRIYRRDATDPNKVAGVFESVERETERSFNSLQSLIALLSKPSASGQAEAADPPARLPAVRAE